MLAEFSTILPIHPVTDNRKFIEQLFVLVTSRVVWQDGSKMRRRRPSHQISIMVKLFCAFSDFLASQNEDYTKTRRRRHNFFYLMALCMTVMIMNKSTTGCNAWEVKTDPAINKMFREAGKLHYMYDPGLFVPLHDGRILALNGRNVGYPGDLQKRSLAIRAADGRIYESVEGMTELFDPDTGSVTVLTKMPFRMSFLLDGQRQVDAIELKDGRILLVGRFEELWANNTKNSDKKVTLQSSYNGIAPATDPTMFGLIYDWTKSTFEILRSAKFAPRCMVTLHLCEDGTVLIIGGATTRNYVYSWRDAPDPRVLSFNPETKELSCVGTINHARYGHTLVALNKHELLLLGGWGPSEQEAKEDFCILYNPDGSCNLYEKRRRTREAEVFDLRTGRSKTIGTTLNDRVDFSAICIAPGKFFLHGGLMNMSGSGFSASELFNLDTGSTDYIGQSRTESQMRFSQDRAPYRLMGEGSSFKAGMKNDKIFLAGTVVFVYSRDDLLNLARDFKEITRGRLIMPREGHQIVRTSKNRVFVLGGKAYELSERKNYLGRADVIEEFVPNQEGE